MFRILCCVYWYGLWKPGFFFNSFLLQEYRVSGLVPASLWAEKCMPYCGVFLSGRWAMPNFLHFHHKIYMSYKFHLAFTMALNRCISISWGTNCQNCLRTFLCWAICVSWKSRAIDCDLYLLSSTKCRISNCWFAKTRWSKIWTQETSFGRKNLAFSSGSQARDRAQNNQVPRRSTGLLTRPFACTAPLIHLLAPQCLLCSHALLRSFVCSLAHSITPDFEGKWMIRCCSEP